MSTTTSATSRRGSPWADAADEPPGDRPDRDPEGQHRDERQERDRRPAPSPEVDDRRRSALREAGVGPGARPQPTLAPGDRERQRHQDEREDRRQGPVERRAVLEVDGPRQAVELEQRDGAEVGQGVEDRQQGAGGIAGTRTGSVTRRNTVIRRSPSSRADSSIAGSTRSSAARVASVTYGNETRVRTRTAPNSPPMLGRRSTPSGASRPWSVPRGPKNAMNANPTTYDGSASGIARQDRPRPPARAGPSASSATRPGPRGRSCRLPTRRRRARASRRRRPRSVVAARKSRAGDRPPPGLG